MSFDLFLSMAGTDEQSYDSSDGCKAKVIGLGRCGPSSVLVASHSTSSSTTRRNKQPQMHALVPCETNFASLHQSTYTPMDRSTCTHILTSTLSLVWSDMRCSQSHIREVPIRRVSIFPFATLPRSPSTFRHLSWRC